MIKKAAGVEKGSAVPNRDKVGKITKSTSAKNCRRKNARYECC